MRIADIIAREILDSRGEPTVEIAIKAECGIFHAAVPVGKSAGSREAVALKYPAAKKSAERIARRISGKSFSTLESLDSFLVRLDGTERKTLLGGNVMLGISMAYARALAFRRQKELWQALRQEFFPRASVAKPPLIFSNLINGGLHAAGTGLDIQEYMAVMGGNSSMLLRVRKLVKLYTLLGETLRRTRKLSGLPLGDEAGYAVRFRNNFEPIQILERVIRRLKLASFCRIGIDAAASSFRRAGKYRFGGQFVDSEKLAGIYRDWMLKVPMFFSLEDPFAERDESGFSAFWQLTKNAWIIGDDLTVTNPRLILTAARGRMINGVIIKPNQIGTVTETCRAIQAARDENLRVIISHRSGETEDNFIIHLAKACGAEGVKIGAPARERMAKFNELIRLYPANPQSRPTSYQ